MDIQAGELDSWHTSWAAIMKGGLIGGVAQPNLVGIVRATDRVVKVRHQACAEIPSQPPYARDNRHV